MCQLMLGHYIVSTRTTYPMLILRAAMLLKSQEHAETVTLHTDFEGGMELFHANLALTQQSPNTQSTWS